MARALAAGPGGRGYHKVLHCWLVQPQPPAVMSSESEGPEGPAHGVPTTAAAVACLAGLD